MKGWFRFTNLELIVITFMVIFGTVVNWQTGVFMFSIGLFIHTITFLIFRNKKDAEDTNGGQDE